MSQRRPLLHRSFMVLLIAGSFFGLTAAADPDTVVPQDKEYVVKAGMVRYFATCVKWPPTAMPADTKEIILGVLGKNPFAGCEKMLSGKEVRGMTIKVVEMKSPADLAGAHIAFIGKGDDGKLGDIMKALDGKPVLTVGETEAFGKAGGVLEFVIEDGKIRFKFDAGAGKKAGLLVNPKLKEKAL